MKTQTPPPTRARPPIVGVSPFINPAFAKFLKTARKKNRAQGFGFKGPEFRDGGAACQA